MLQSENDDLLDQVYETAYEPGLWPAVFERLADKLGGSGIWLSQLDALDGSGGSPDDPLARIDPMWLDRYAQYFGPLNPLQRVSDPRKFLREWQPIVHTDDAWIEKNELVRTEFYHGFLAPQDIHSILWIRLLKNGTQTATLNVTRPKRRDSFEQKRIVLAREYQPHLIRAFKMAKKLGTDRRKHADVEALLDISPNGFFLLDANGKIQHTNSAGERLLAEPGVFSVTHGKLRAVLPSAAKQLEALIAIAASPDAGTRRGGSMAIPSPQSALPLSVLVTPIGGHKFAPIKDGLSVCLCVTDLNAEMRLPRSPLHNVFGLTDAEIRVAQALFEGASLQEIAARFGVSHNTVRVQLASIFDKTHTNRQVDLIAMLARLSHVRAS
ncbi:MAG TPA: LuxR C-terminal-related transcriptional regulator [Rhizomicrobium sp.]|jgi:DNA-binding CsgD family transcriptional regulator/PAS domain-containing protein